MDLPKNELGVELKKRTFEPELIVSPGKEKVVEQLKKAGRQGRRDLSCARPGPRRRGDCLPPRDAAWHQRQREKEDSPRHLQRDYEEGRAGSLQARARHRSEPGGRAADAARARPPGGLPDFAAALGQGAARISAGPRADRGAAADRGARARDSRVPARRILDAGSDCFIPRSRRQEVQGEVHRHRRRAGARGERQGQGRQRAVHLRTRCPTRSTMDEVVAALEKADWSTGQHAGARAAAQAAGAVHHQPTAARRSQQAGLQRAPHDGRGAAAL